MPVYCGRSKPMVSEGMYSGGFSRKCREGQQISFLNSETSLTLIVSRSWACHLCPTEDYGETWSQPTRFFMATWMLIKVFYNSQQPDTPEAMPSSWTCHEQDVCQGASSSQLDLLPTGMAFPHRWCLPEFTSICLQVLPWPSLEIHPTWNHLWWLTPIPELTSLNILSNRLIQASKSVYW